MKARHQSFWYCHACREFLISISSWAELEHQKDHVVVSRGPAQHPAFPHDERVALG
jgi:hypothetical protein